MAAVEREAARFGCSRSWIVAVNLAAMLGVTVDAADDYRRAK